jgi:hypothetical protein
VLVFGGGSLHRASESEASHDSVRANGGASCQGLLSFDCAHTLTKAGSSLHLELGARRITALCVCPSIHREQHV